MDLVVIEKDIEILKPIVKCSHCNEEKKKMNYFYMRDAYYCNDCYKLFPNIDSVFDTKFKELEKQLKEIHSSLAEKNKRILFLENQTAVMSDIYELLENIVKEENKNENQ